MDESTGPKLVGTPFAVVPEWVLYGQLSDRAVRLYGVLQRHVNGEEGYARPGRQRLARLLRCDEKTLDRAMRELTEIGAVQVIPWYRPGTTVRTANHYLVRADNPAYAVASSAPPPVISAPTVASSAPPLERKEVEREDLATATPTRGSRAVPAEPDRLFEAPTASRAALVVHNLGFDALCEVCGIDPRGNQRALVAVALNGGRGVRRGIREMCAEEFVGLDDDERHFEEYVAGRIREVAKRYRDVMRGAVLTPTALAKWWTDLPQQTAGRGLTPEEIHERGQRLLRGTGS